MCGSRVCVWGGGGGGGGGGAGGLDPPFSGKSQKYFFELSWKSYQASISWRASIGMSAQMPFKWGFAGMSMMARL